MSPLQAFEGMFVFALSVFVGIILLVFFLRRMFAWMDRRGWIMYTGDPPTYGSLGNAFLELQKLAQPQMEYILEQKEAEKQKLEEDGEAGPDDPTRKLS
jgi:hypothetical protein